MTHSIFLNEQDDEDECEEDGEDTLVNLCYVARLFLRLEAKTVLRFCRYFAYLQFKTLPLFRVCDITSLNGKKVRYLGRFCSNSLVVIGVFSKL